MKTQIGCILGFSQIAAAESVDDVRLLRDDDTRAQDKILREAQVNMIKYAGSPDGVIRKEKMHMFKNALKKSNQLIDQQVEDLISKMDTNGNGEIDATEYLAYVKGLLDVYPERKHLLLERLYSAVGENGRVSEKAMKKLFRLDEFGDLLEAYDVNKDGKLSLHEVSLEERKKSLWWKFDDNKFDEVDGDDMISVDEFASPNEEKWEENFFKKLDYNGDGQITEADFDKLRAMTKQDELNNDDFGKIKEEDFDWTSEDEFEEIWRSDDVDFNGDGKITEEDFDLWAEIDEDELDDDGKMTEEDFDLTIEDELEDGFSEMDQNGDGKMTQEDFDLWAEIDEK